MELSLPLGILRDFAKLNCRSRPPRQCPGLYLGDAILFSLMSSVLAVFDITQPIDATTGMAYMPDVDCTSGNIRYVLTWCINDGRDSD